MSGGVVRERDLLPAPGAIFGGDWLARSSVTPFMGVRMGGDLEWDRTRTCRGGVPATAAIAVGDGCAGKHCRGDRSGDERGGRDDLATGEDLLSGECCKGDCRCSDLSRRGNDLECRGEAAWNPECRGEDSERRGGDRVRGDRERVRCSRGRRLGGDLERDFRVAALDLCCHAASSSTGAL